MEAKLTYEQFQMIKDQRNKDEKKWFEEVQERNKAL